MVRPGKVRQDNIVVDALALLYLVGKIDSLVTGHVCEASKSVLVARQGAVGVWCISARREGKGRGWSRVG